MKLLRILSWVAATAILALVASAGVAAAENRDSEEITQLLERVRSHVAQADYDAHTLESYTRSQLHWKTHAAQLDRIREHVNNLITDTNEMVSMRSEGSPWQREAVDRISVLLPEISAHMTTTINHLKDNQNRVQMKPYRDLAVANRDLIHHANEVISDMVDYGEAKAKADLLEQQLQMPAPEKAS